MPCRCSYPCIYCGPPSKYDFTLEEPDDELDAYSILDNFKAAMANKCVAHVSLVYSCSEYLMAGCLCKAICRFLLSSTCMSPQRIALCVCCHAVIVTACKQGPHTVVRHQ